MTLSAQTDKVVRVECNAWAVDVLRSQLDDVMNFFRRSIPSFRQTVLTQEAVPVYAIVSYIPPCLAPIESLSKVSHGYQKAPPILSA